MTKIRKIVKDAFRVDELVYQFDTIDVEDGVLTSDDTMAEVNEKYSDAYIVGEAKWRLSIALDNIADGAYGEDLKAWRKDERQLKRFINKYSEAAA